MKKTNLTWTLAALACCCTGLGALVLDSGAVRSAGWPHGLGDLEGRWVLDRVRGDFATAPPATLVFSEGSSPDLVRVSADQGEAEFEVHGPGRLVFAEGQSLEPLLAAGATEAHVMTHLCPPLPAWDHLKFFPDGPPDGPDATRRSVTYERE